MLSRVSGKFTPEGATCRSIAAVLLFVSLFPRVCSDHLEPPFRCLTGGRLTQDRLSETKKLLSKPNVDGHAVDAIDYFSRVGKLEASSTALPSAGRVPGSGCIGTQF